MCATMVFITGNIFIFVKCYIKSFINYNLHRDNYYYIRQRSWTDAMYSPLLVRLSVCLLAGLLKKLWTDFTEILWEGSQLPKDHSMAVIRKADPDYGSGTSFSLNLSLRENYYS